MSKVTATVNRAAYPLSVFRYRNFSFVWASTTLVGMGTQMEAVVLAWFILNLSDSPFLVGAISAARMSLNILALFAGAVADRVPRHRLLNQSQGGNYILQRWQRHGRYQHQCVS